MNKPALSYPLIMINEVNSHDSSPTSVLVTAGTMPPTIIALKLLTFLSLVVI